MKRKNLRALLITLLYIALTLSLSACGCTHDYDDWEIVKEATCLENGKKERECDKCGKEQSKSIPKSGHDYEQELTTEASCHGNGEYTYTCKFCEDSYTEAIPSTKYSSTEIHDMFINSVGEVTVYDKNNYELGLGSCFVYKENGTLLTNYHVIEGACYADVTFGDDTYEVEKVLAYDKDLDIAVLKISKTGMDAVPLCYEDHDVGSTVYAFGSSQGMTSTFSNGMITYSNRDVDGVTYVQHDVPISSGNSGGPLINEYGEVIGINTWTVVDSQNLNFAIHLSQLDALDYSSAMTLEEVYQKECDVYSLLKEYIITNGEYDAEDGFYTIKNTEYYSSDYSTTYTRLSYYFVESDTFSFDLSVDEGDYWVYVYFEIDPDVDGTYFWSYFDYEDYTMSGIMVAETFDDSTSLSYDDHYISEASTRWDVRELSSMLMVEICSSISTDYADLGITAADLGFNHFD